MWTTPETRAPAGADYTFLPALNSSVDSWSASVSQVNVSYAFRYRANDRLYFGFRPFFNALLLGGPEGWATYAFPEQAYGFGLDASAAFRVSPRWTIFGGSTVGVFSNFEDLGSSDYMVRGMVRGPGRLLAAYRPTESLTLAFGVMFLDNPALDWLPTGGVVWTPSQRFRMELLFPRARLFFRPRESLSVYGLFQFADSLYSVGEPRSAPNANWKDRMRPRCTDSPAAAPERKRYLAPTFTGQRTSRGLSKGSFW